tara:strand:+ start:87924 stop:92234 length:4311 start_codon:yes stop_codon:yes gene_type:complete
MGFSILQKNEIMSDPEESDSSENPEPASEPTRANVNPESIEGLFLIALEKKTPAERAGFLDEMCGDNAEQRRRVDALLLAYDDAGSFLEKSPVGSSERQSFSLDFLTPANDPDLLGTLGEYQIQEVIGQGGMGIVFRALDPKLNRIVAIKVMSPLLAVNPNARKRFLREAQAAAAVSHPHIVTIHAVDEDKLPYLVMEYVVGQSLQEKLDKVGSLSMTEILRIGNQIAEGLAAAHKQGLIHRDIKPANILLENGVERVKITDFGLARAVDDVTITKTGEVSGTPQYMSPEQAAGNRVDQRSDLFSLGAVLYAMCTGRSPFRASNLVAVVRRVCDDTPRPIRDVNEEIPDWLIEIIDCLLEKRPDDRFQTASEVADLLGAHLAIVQHPGVVPKMDGKPLRSPRQAAAPQPVAPEKDSSGSTPAVVLKKGSTPAGYIIAILLGLVLGTVIGLKIISPSTSESSMTYDMMSKIVKFSFTLIFILSIASLVYWNRADKKPLPFLTWFLSTLAMFLTLGLSFITTAVVRAAPLGTEFNSMHGSILAASVLGVLAVAGFAMRGQWLHILKQGPDYVAAVKQKDARTLTGTGIGIWVLMVLFYWMFSTGFYQPAFLASGEWHFAPILIFSLLGGLFVTAGFLMERSWRQDYAARNPELEGTSAYSMNQFEPAGVSRGSWGDRAAVWAGGIMLLIPLFLWLIGTATGGHFTASVSEMVIVSLLFFSPVGLLVFICGAQNLVEPDSRSEKLMEGLFLLACFLLGPLGILLYIVRYLKRRDAQVKEKDERPPVVPGDDPFVQEHRRSNKRIILGVVVGVLILLSLILFVQNWRLLGITEQYRALNWGLKLVVLCGMFVAAYFIKRKGASAARNNPWNIMGWGTAVLAGMFTLSMLMEIVSPVSTDTNDLVFIDYRPNRPITEIELVETGEKYQVDSHPAVMHLKKGRHTLRISYSGNGRIHTLDRSIHKVKSMSLRIDVSQEIDDRLRRNQKQEIVKNQEQEPAEWDKNLGAIILSGEDPDLRAGVFPVQETASNDMMFGGGMGELMGYPDLLLTQEPMSLEIPAGKYLIRVSSELAGWENYGRSPTFDLTKIEVKPGTIVPVTISRDYAKLAENRPDWSKGGLFKFRWPDSRGGARQVYILSARDAVLVQQLFEAFAEGKPDVAEAELLKTANSGVLSGSYDSLEQYFKNGKHPAWGALIVPGKETGTWRLAEPKFIQAAQKSPLGMGSPFPGVSKQKTAKREAGGMIMLSTEEPGLQVEVKPADAPQKLADDPDFWMMKKNLSGKSIYEMSPGEYQILVTSGIAGWEIENRPPHYVDSQVTVKPGEVITETIRHDFQKLAEQHPDWAEGNSFKFHWPDSKTGLGAVYTLSAPQARVIQQLLSAFAEEKLEINEKILLTTANTEKTSQQFQTLQELFDDGEHPAWKGMIDPGETEHSWRLRDPRF